MISRNIMKILRKSVSQFPILTLTGPRQSGKTTLLRQEFTDYQYVLLEDADQLEFATHDPRGFLNQFLGKKVIIDEAQNAPELFSYIQGIVDDNPHERFILSGSQNFALLEKVTQSLAGRTDVHYLMPFTLSELCGQMPTEQEIFGREIPEHTKPWAPDLFDTILKGFYPRIRSGGIEANDWLRAYYRTYLERDVRSIANIGDINQFSSFVRLVAGRVGQLSDFSGLAGDAGISHTTAKRWLSILETSFIVFKLSPYFRNFNKRLIKSPKIYFVDTGLLCYLLGIQSADHLITHPLRGQIFENFVIAEFLKNRYHGGRDPNLYFWRDSSGTEVDLIIDHGMEIQGIELKSGQTVQEDFFRNLQLWQKYSQKDCPLAVIYGGESSMMRSGVGVYSWRHI